MQEVNGITNTMFVACYNANDVFTVRNSDFDAARIDLTFDVNRGHVETTAILNTAVFDNSVSDTKLESKFTFQKEVTKTSEFHRGGSRKGPMGAPAPPPPS